MERTVTVILTNSNDKKVFTSNATTLGELKAEMDSKNIDYRGMDFMEGLTHTTMIDNSAILPSNINYKGTITNNLVFMLSNTNKNIRSGADFNRAELYKKIKEYNLQDIILKKFNKNYTQCTSNDLAYIISKHETKMNNVVPVDRKGIYEYIKKNNLEDSIKKTFNDNYTHVSTVALYNFCKTNTSAVKHCCKKSKSTIIKSPYSDSEINEMFKNLK